MCAAGRCLGTLPGLLVFTAAVRLLVGGVLLQVWGSSFPVASDDGQAYDAAARWLVWGQPIDAVDPWMRWPAGYWLLLAAEYRLLGYQHVSAVVLQSGLAAIATLATYRLAERLLPDPRLALLAGYATALASTLVLLSATLTAESVYVPLLLVGVWAAVLRWTARMRFERAPWRG
jgi:hypothetical protein